MRRRPQGNDKELLLAPPVDDPHHPAGATIYLKYPVTILPEDEAVGGAEPLTLQRPPTLNWLSKRSLFLVWPGGNISAAELRDFIPT